MTLTPISWIVEGYKNINGSYITIEMAYSGYIARLNQEWPLPQFILSFNNEDFFWHHDLEIQPYYFRSKEEAAKAALKT